MPKAIPPETTSVPVWRKDVNPVNNFLARFHRSRPHAVTLVVRLLVPVSPLIQPQIHYFATNSIWLYTQIPTKVSRSSYNFF